MRATIPTQLNLIIHLSSREIRRKKNKKGKKRNTQLEYCWRQTDRVKTSLKIETRLNVNRATILGFSFACCWSFSEMAQHISNDHFLSFQFNSLVSGIRPEQNGAHLECLVTSSLFVNCCRLSVFIIFLSLLLFERPTDSCKILWGLLRGIFDCSLRFYVIFSVLTIVLLLLSFRV